MKPECSACYRWLIGVWAVTAVVAAAAEAPTSFEQWKQKDQKAYQEFLKGAKKEGPAKAAAAAGAAWHPLPGKSRVPTGERIFFMKKHKVGDVMMGDIYSMKPDGSDVQPLTSFSSEYYVTDYPQLSRDGRTLLFISNYKAWVSALYEDVFIVDLAGGRFRRVTGDERPLPPTKTGTLQVTMNNPTDANSQMFRISFKGCDRFWTPGQNGPPMLAPAGENIWVKCEKQWGLGDLQTVIVTEGGTEAVTLDASKGTFEAEFAGPSPDGSLVAVSTVVGDRSSSYWSVSIFRADGTPLIDQNVGGNNKEGGDGGAVFSPDGTKLAYCPGRPAKNNLGMLSTANLTAAPTILVQTSMMDVNMCAAPAWSPDGRYIIFLYGSTDGVTYANFNIYRVSVQGGTPEPLTSLPSGTWAGKCGYSPDGSRIVFTLCRGGNQNDLYVMPSGGGAAQALTRDGASSNPTWGVVAP